MSVKNTSVARKRSSSALKAKESASISEPSEKTGQYYFKSKVVGCPKHSFNEPFGPKSDLKYDECGEDSFAIAENQFQHVVAIADGVGAYWNAAIFTRSLMNHLESEMKSEKEESSESKKAKISENDADCEAETGCSEEAKSPSIKPVKQAFKSAYEMTRKLPENKNGGCTVCMVSIDKATGMMEGGNLGDSAYIVVREGKIIERSNAQHHGFNWPYQVSYNKDETDLMEVQALQLQEGDLLVLATDGLWDNLFEEEYMKVILEGKDVEETAESLFYETRKRAATDVCDCPWSRMWKRGEFKGGKNDDLTIIVAMVQKKNN